MSSLRSRWLIAFGVAAVAHLILLVAQLEPWDTVTKCLIAPLLAGWVIEQRGPRLLVAALLFCFLGDLFLDLPEAFFVPGMAAFAAAHVCFVVFFVQRGALAALRGKWPIPVALLVLAVALLAWVWPGLETGLRGPVVVYALLLSATAATALAVDLRAGVGALLFLFSDGLIAARIADRVSDGVVGGFVVMLTYSLALFFLATAIVLKEARSRSTGFDPTRPTDCWPRLPSQAP